MYNIGVFSGKFSPPHRGHINAILQASTKCKLLYVVISQDDNLEKTLYENTGICPIPLREKLKWMSIELNMFDHIKILTLDESNIPSYPNGWELWSKALKGIIKEPIEAIFGSDVEYKAGYNKYFPETIYEIFDSERSKYPISATEIRANPYKHWDYILGVARPYFTKRVLVTGTESCGKSTLVGMLGKVFFTSWTVEEGRFYSTRYFGGNDSLFQSKDFFKICCEQKKTDEKALRTANKIVFFDTDAVVTQYYCELYTGKQNKDIEVMINPDDYDLVLMLKPDVPWVPDGFRWKSEDSERIRLHEHLKQMYIDRGFGSKIVEIGGNYSDRMDASVRMADKLLQ